MVSGGHNAKPTLQLKREGRYEAGRHGDRVDDQYEGMPELIRGLGKDGQYLWKLITENTPPGILVTVDSAAMFAMCRWWAAYRKFERKAMGAKSKPHDLYQASTAWKQCSQLMIQFGLTPIARTRLKGGEKAAELNDPLSQMIRNRAS